MLEFLKLGIKLVFVVDGRAPDVKHKTMVQRQQQQFGSAATCLSSPDRLWMSSQVDKVESLWKLAHVIYRDFLSFKN